MTPAAARAGGARAGTNRPVRSVLRWIHATCGLFAAVYLLMAAFTGSLLLFRREIVALAVPDLAPLPADTVTQAQRLAATLEPGAYTAIRFPDETLRVFTVHHPDHTTSLYDPATLAPVDDTFGLNRAMDWLFELHHYLLAGETGRIASGGFGLAMAGLVLLGLYLWWPWRRGWRLSNAHAKRPTRASHLAAHTTLGILMAPVLLVASVTGSAIVFSDQAKAILIGALGEKDPAVEPAPGTGTLASLAGRQFPDAAPRLLSAPKEEGGPVTLRFRQPEEAHPNGRTMMSWDPATARVTDASSEPESGAGNRAFNILYPIHIGTIGGLPLRVVYMLSAVAALFAAVHALRSKLGRRGR